MKNLDIKIPNKGALDRHRHRVIVTTDIGGIDPDDFQSMVHFLLYANCLDVEGLISSCLGGTGRIKDIMQVIGYYEKDYDNLRKYSDTYPEPDVLRALTKQGELQSAPYVGFRTPTAASRWIVKCARKDDLRPLYILGWGGLEDIAQALHDAPDILPRIRVHWVGGPNKKWGPDAYQYIAGNHPDLWIIESNSTYRGWFTGGDQDGQWGNREFVKKFIAGKGALGEFFNTQIEGVIKMGDTPTVGWLLKGNPEDPSQPGWGGQFVRAWDRPYVLFNRMPAVDDRMEVFGILEIALPLPEGAGKETEAKLAVKNQELPGYLPGDGTIRFRFSAKGPKVFHFIVKSNQPLLDGQTGAITAYLPGPFTANRPSSRYPNWWTDIPAPEWAEGEHHGAKTVSCWRHDFLTDFARRIARCGT